MRRSRGIMTYAPAVELISKTKATWKGGHTMTETEKEKLTIVVFSGELDRALAAFMLATTGASMGMEVKMFFTFWGLNIIKKNEGSIVVGVNPF